MALKKPSPGDNLYAADARDLALYAEASKPIPGPGITVRRTLAGSVISLAPTTLFSMSAGSGGGGGAGYTDGEKRWGRVAYIESSHKFVQFQETYSATTTEWKEDAVGTDITTFISHDIAHGTF